MTVENNPVQTAIRAIIFDFGNVLDYDEHYDKWVEYRHELAAELNMTGDEMWEWFYQTDPWQQVKKGKISYPEFWNRVLSPRGITDKAAQEDFVNRLFEGRDRIHPEMEALLRALKPHYKLAILSNTFEPEMESWLAQKHGLDCFDTVVSSAREGMAKPEPAIYQRALERLGVRAEEALFIDDMPRNTKAAEAQGIRSIVFENPAQLREALSAMGVLPVDQTAQ